jgi:hypothetical protein
MFFEMFCQWEAKYEALSTLKSTVAYSALHTLLLYAVQLSGPFCQQSRSLRDTRFTCTAAIFTLPLATPFSYILQPLPPTRCYSKQSPAPFR